MTKCFQKEAGTMGCEIWREMLKCFPCWKNSLKRMNYKVWITREEPLPLTFEASLTTLQSTSRKRQLYNITGYDSRSLLTGVTIRFGGSTAWTFEWSNLTDEVRVDNTRQVLDISCRIPRIIQDRNECIDAFRIDLPLWSYIFCTNIHKKTSTDHDFVSRMIVLRFQASPQD